MLPLLIALAGAADLEASVELATIPTTHASQRAFGDANSMPAIGGRVGLALTDALTVQLAAHHGRRGADWYAGNTPIGTAAFFSTDAALGLEAVVPIAKTFAIGGVGEATAILGAARFDDDRSDPDSPVQLRQTALSPGFRAGLAIRVTVPESAMPTPLLFRISPGYEVAAPLKMGETGATTLRGFDLRMSVGLRF